MDLKCKNGECNNVYKMKVSGKGYGYIGQVIVAWKCVVCGKWNVFAKGKFDGIGVSINLGW